MPYGFDDFLQENQNNNREVFSSEIGSLNVVDHPTASRLFPGVSLSQSEHLSYFPFKLCHSLPVINKRGRCFTGTVLANSFASAVDQLIDVEHLISANGLTNHDRICGHIKAIKLDTGEIASEIAKVPSQAIPALALGCLFNRANSVKNIVNNHSQGKEVWGTSMECGHDWSEAYLLYEDKFIPFKEADGEMVRCVKSDHVLPFKNKPLAVCLGGVDKSVELWGVALTRTPADAGADILHFIAGRSREAASTKKVFYMPIHEYDNKALEVASATVESVIAEMASVSVLGETDADQNGEVHTILSDMTIMPSMSGHGHDIKTMHVSRGSAPKITGVTTPHHQYNQNSGGSSMVHAHTFAIPLRGKVPATASTPEEYASEIASLKEIGDLAVDELKKLLEKLQTTSTALATALDANERTRLAGELASINKEIAQIQAQTATEQQINAAIEDKKTAGELLTKAQADALVEAKAKELEEKAKQDRIATEKKASRLAKLKEAGIDPEYVIPEVTDKDGKPVTIGGRVEQFALDDTGDREYTINFQSWKAQRDAELKLKEVNATEEEKKAAALAAAAANGQQAAEAASAGKKSIILAAGAGPSEKTGEVANTKTDPVVGSKADWKRGKSRFQHLQKA